VSYVTVTILTGFGISLLYSGFASNRKTSSTMDTRESGQIGIDPTKRSC
jgi:hypothetical protein